MRDKANDTARLALMLDSILNIESFIEGIEDADAFAANRMLCHAVFYNLQCIGESVYKLSGEFTKSHPEMDWEAIEGLRHVLVHDYYQVSPGRIWAILEQDLPNLKSYLLDSET